MREPKIDELVIHTQEVIKQFLEKRDVLLKLIEKELIKLAKKQSSRVRHLKFSKKNLLEELDKILRRLVEFDVERGFKRIYDFEREYHQIYNREVHPDIMKREMIKFLSNSADNVLEYAKQFDELYRDISSFNKYLKGLSPTRTECIDALKEQMNATTICKHQCHENVERLREAIVYFDVPPECPPQL